MLKQLLSKVANPGAEFRGAPFWAWNAKLGEHELRRQIRLLKKMGLGGFFMHARVGLGTEYLGKDWFDCVKACLDEAKKNDMQPWLYDEDRWPSGAAGSLVTKERKFARRELLMTSCDKLAQVPANILETSSKKTVILGDYKTEYPCDEAKLLAVYSAKIDGLNACDVKREKTVPKTLPKGRTLLFFHCCVQPRSSWYNGESYLDTMNPEAVQKFVKVTHEAYRKEIGDEFGKSVPGIFTDEPNYKVDLGTKDCAWTENLPAIFQKRYGYSLIDHLPELYFFVDGKQVSKARLDYRNLCTDLFVTAFSKTIGTWCGKNNMQMTGHVLCEDELLQQASAVGAAMRFYEYMQVPGIDLLTEHWGIFDTAKQCTSAAHQFGRPAACQRPTAAQAGIFPSPATRRWATGSSPWASISAASTSPGTPWTARRSATTLLPSPTSRPGIAILPSSRTILRDSMLPCPKARNAATYWLSILSNRPLPGCPPTTSGILRILFSPASAGGSTEFPPTSWPLTSTSTTAMKKS